MTEKEIAKELVERFTESEPFLSDIDAKQCALICIDMMEKSHEDWATEQQEVFASLDKIRQEIKAL